MAKIGQYKLGDVLGVGTVGTVYRSKNRETGQDVALKVLLPQISADSNIAHRFEREMSILERLDHPHIVRYLSGGQQDGRLYYVMELVDAGSLKDELTIQGRLSWQQVCEYGIQICSALQHAHNHGIIHRDLKPANLFMNEAGNLKLGDFGIARDTHQADLTDMGLTVGTYAYMAPEQIRADENVSDKVDLYALGCLLYEMLTGHQPFEGANFAQIFDQHLQRVPPHVRAEAPSCPQELDQLIADLMAKDPDQRPFNARYVQGYLQQVIDRQAIAEDAGDLASSAESEEVVTPGGDSAPDPSSGVPRLSPYREISWAQVGAVLMLIGLIIGVAYLARFVTT